MQEQPSKIHHLQHLFHRHRLRVIAVAVTVAVLIVLFITSLIYFPTDEYSEEPLPPISEPEYLNTHEAVTVQTGTPPPTEAQKAPASAEPVLPPPERLTPVTVKAGESLSTIFRRVGISQEQLLDVIKLPGVEKQIRTLRAGKVLEFEIGHGQQLQTLIMPVSSTEKLVVTRTATGFTEATLVEKLDVSTERAEMVIHSSFYADGEKAGIPAAILANYLSIFKWTVNFDQGSRQGDKVAMIYEVITNSRTHKSELGTIVAASYTHQNKTTYAIRYPTGVGTQVDYYDPNGKNLRKAFRRKPLDIGYISSPFNPKRMHPVLGVVRPHMGTDFAAPSGTPIYATGDGRIILRGRKGGYGRCIMISHGNGIVTLYGHMSRFATQFKQGSYVKMGQVIGYVGSSGLSSGPHVHYEYRVNKQFKNPMTVPLPNGAPVAVKKRPVFIEYAKQEIALLNPAAMTDNTSNQNIKP
jgi:murein DD-endopeptidase MepM/ murein hydrolase activator NlpD